MKRLAFDIETNGLLDELTKLHCLCIRDIDNNFVVSCVPHLKAGEEDIVNGWMSIEDGLKILSNADLLFGHNVVKFDIPAIQKVYPQWSTKAVVRDTLILTRVVWPDIKESDHALVKKGKLPAHLRGRYSLEAFGYRLGKYKGDYRGGWEAWSKEMQDYCEQDIEVTCNLWDRLHQSMEAQRGRTNGKAWTGNTVELEHRVQDIIMRQENLGFLFDRVAAMELCHTLAARRAELLGELQNLFHPWLRSKGEFTPKRDNKKLGYLAGQTFTKLELHSFNPASRHDVADRLIKLRGWSPTEFTPDGHPKIDDTVLSRLPYPEAKALAEYFLVEKRLGALAEGKEAWLKAVKGDGRIHGQVMTGGAVTGRMTHMRPNITQVPSLKAKYGGECRALFIAPEGKKLVGCDADALELRCLAGYMARYDDGAYIETVLRGNKDLGTDMHSVNARAISLDPEKKYEADGRLLTGRDIAKVWFYAFIYGAGDWKLGHILGVRGAKTKVSKAGGKSRETFLTSLPALKKLVDAVRGRVKSLGGLVAIDGRFLRVRSEHAALNTLLQSAGAIFMKQALVILDDRLPPGAEFVANVHDEWQIEAAEEIAEEVGKAAADSIRLAGEFFSFACPLAGNYSVGNNWRDTH